MRVRIAAPLIIVLLCLGGCSAESSASAGDDLAPMWRDQYDQALANPSISDFTRNVLLDYQVTDEEYRESREGFKQCMADYGWTVTLFDHGISVGGTPGGPHAHANDSPSADDPSIPDQGKCYAVWGTGDIEGIYIGMKYNPQGLTAAQSIRQCFEKYDIHTGDGLSDDQLFQLMVSDYLPTSPEEELCLSDPEGTSGMTIEQAQKIYEDRQQQAAANGGTLPQPTLPMTCTQYQPDGTSVPVSC